MRPRRPREEEEEEGGAAAEEEEEEQTAEGEEAKSTVSCPSCCQSGRGGDF